MFVGLIDGGGGGGRFEVMVNGGGGGGGALEGSAVDTGGGGGRESPVKLGAWCKVGTEGGGTAMPKLVLFGRTQKHNVRISAFSAYVR